MSIGLWEKIKIKLVSQAADSQIAGYFQQWLATADSIGL